MCPKETDGKENDNNSSKSEDNNSREAVFEDFIEASNNVGREFVRIMDDVGKAASILGSEINGYLKGLLKKSSDLQKDYSGDVSFDQNSNYSKDISTKSINNSNAARKPVQQSNNNLPSYLLVEEYMKQAQQGDREAQFNLAMKYRNGTNVPKDYAKAFSLMEQSAKQNYVTAQYWLSIFYKDGIGTEPNETLSIEWLKRAAVNGNSAAKDSLRSRLKNYKANNTYSTQNSTSMSNTPAENRVQLLQEPDSQQSESLNDIKVLDENDLFISTNSIPIIFDYEYGLLENKAVVKACNILLNYDMAKQAMSDNSILQLEQGLQVKRAKGRDIKANLIYELYTYSSFMNMLNVLCSNNYTSIKADFQKLSMMIQMMCKERINDFERERQNNPAIDDMLRKYTTIHNQYKMRILNDVSQLENDYIIAALMSSTVMYTMGFLIDGEYQAQGGNRTKAIQLVKSYSPKIVMQTLNRCIVNSAAMRISSYSGEPPFLFSL